MGKGKPILMVLALMISAPVFANNNDDATKNTSSGADTPHADNSVINKRDNDGRMLTPGDQAAGSAGDVELTRRIRQLVTSDKSLSVNAHNVKIITLNGVTTLRGPVNSSDERVKIEGLAAQVVGKNSVRSSIEVKTVQ